MDVKQLRSSLNRLFRENSTAVSKATVETLLKIHRNIKFNEQDPKYRKLKLENPVFKNQVWNLYPAQYFMLQSGWAKVGNELHFDKDENLWYIIDILLEFRNVRPSSSEWQETSKIENLHVSEQKDKDLRAKAAVVREKELKEYAEEKLYREKLAESVKKQIADDRKNRRPFVNSPPPRDNCNPHYSISRRLDS